MKNKYRIFFEDKTGYIIIGTRRMSIDDAVDIFRIRMLNTLKAMKDGKISKAITLNVKEVEP